MKKFLTIVGLMTIVATPAFAQPFDSDNGTGNVLAFSYKSTAAQNHKPQPSKRSRSSLGSRTRSLARAAVRLPPRHFGISVWSRVQLSLSDRPYGDPDHW
jgi:hypothetical protein